MKLSTATLVVLMLGTAPALASNERGAAVPMMPAFDFATADADADGAITREEWGNYVGDLMQTRRAALFDRRAGQMIEAGDTDGDGLLSRAELASALEARHDAFRDRRAERAGQQAGERTERRAERAERRADGERAGQQAGERTERRAERAERRAGGERAEGRGNRPDRGQGPRTHRERMMDPEAFAERSFRRLDADGDGQISAEEFAAAQERWQQRPGRRRAGDTD